MDRSVGGAGWSSPVARQAHNLKVVGSNPTPATNKQGPLVGPFLLAFIGFDFYTAWRYTSGIASFC